MGRSGHRDKDVTLKSRRKAAFELEERVRKLTKDLIQKSQDSFLLALELYNKPTVGYRFESFSILFTNAWELLLKAKLFEDSHARRLSIFRKKRRNERRQSVSLDECLEKLFLDSNDPVRQNIEFTAAIRNEASHLIISDFSPYYSRAFQSGVINYLRKLEEWFGRRPDAFLPPGFLSLITDEQLPNMEKIKKRYNKADFATLLEWATKYEQLQRLGSQGALSIKHTIAIVKNPRKADFVISGGGSSGEPLFVVDRMRDVDETHPHRLQDVLSKVNAILNKQPPVNSYDLQAYLFVRNLRKSNNEYFWQTKYASGQYSEKLVQEFTQSIRGDNGELANWRSQYGQHIRSKQRRKKV